MLECVKNFGLLEWGWMYFACEKNMNFGVEWYGLNVCVPPPPYSYVIALTSYVMVFADGALGGNSD